MTRAAWAIAAVSARASSGSDTPMKNVGQSRLTNSIAPRASAPAAQMAESLIQHAVVQVGAEKAERGDRELGGGKAGEVGSGRQPIRDLRPGEIAAPEPGHEGRDDDRGGVDVGAVKDDQQPLPDDLVDERGEA